MVGISCCVSNFYDSLLPISEYEAIKSYHGKASRVGHIINLIGHIYPQSNLSNEETSHDFLKWSCLLAEEVHSKKANQIGYQFSEIGISYLFWMIAASFDCFLQDSAVLRVVWLIFAAQRVAP